MPLHFFYIIKINYITKKFFSVYFFLILLIYAENRMEILEIVAQDATVVEEGDTLFRVKILPDNEEEC